MTIVNCLWPQSSKAKDSNIANLYHLQYWFWWHLHVDILKLVTFLISCWKNHDWRLLIIVVRREIENWDFIGGLNSRIRRQHLILVTNRFHLKQPSSTSMLPLQTEAVTNPNQSRWACPLTNCISSNNRNCSVAPPWILKWP